MPGGGRGLEFTALGRPLTWKRTNSYPGRRIKDKVARQYMDWLRAAAQGALYEQPDWPTGARYRLTVTACVHGVRGDWDNYGKIVGDALQRSADSVIGVLWEDDRQILDGRVQVRPASREDQRMVVSVEVIE